MKNSCLIAVVEQDWDGGPPIMPAGLLEGFSEGLLLL